MRFRTANSAGKRYHEFARDSALRLGRRPHESAGLSRARERWSGRDGGTPRRSRFSTRIRNAAEKRGLRGRTHALGNPPSRVSGGCVFRSSKRRHWKRLGMSTPRLRSFTSVGRHMTCCAWKANDHNQCLPFRCASARSRNWPPVADRISRSPGRSRSPIRPWKSTFGSVYQKLHISSRAQLDSYVAPGRERAVPNGDAG